MPRRRDFYCDFYCAVDDGRCGSGTQRHASGSRGLAKTSCARGLTRTFTRIDGRRSASNGLGRQTPRRCSGYHLSHHDRAVHGLVAAGGQ